MPSVTTETGQILESLLNDLAVGRGLFDPNSPSRHQRRLARAAAPALLAATGGLGSAEFRSIYGLKGTEEAGRASIAQARTTGELGIQRQNVMEAGATGRQKLMGETERYKADKLFESKKYMSDKEEELLKPYLDILMELKGVGGTTAAKAAKVLQGEIAEDTQVFMEDKQEDVPVWADSAKEIEDRMIELYGGKKKPRIVEWDEEEDRAVQIYGP